ncbi:aldehyde oxidase GLOX-like [Punica granatum]|uniref:Aldehyde oxidase GLOX n=1 Tax=Punica granatum TaxID=22663 RepID=A0A218X872_PUNGR|nr:aldehyde oxidase GLOX-like [Punica granatum]OWM80899.1 hypothetical protein CDL15_Pgr006930 [Punica granatum]
MISWSRDALPFLLFRLLAVAILSQRHTFMVAADGGGWQLLQRSIGVSAMHMQLLHNDRVIIFDRTDFGKSNLSLPGGKCRRDPNDQALKVDCTAHSVEFDVATNTFRPLMVLTDTWCSSGSVMPDGRLVQTGGFNDGGQKVRVMEPCGGGCDWNEIGDELAAPRWYATNQLLPDGRQIVIGGRRQFNYEFYPKSTKAPGAYSLPFLAQTTDPNLENNLYPFVHLNVDGNLFMFANNRAILFDYVRNKVVRTYPALGGDPRNYPSSGSSVLLPLDLQMAKVEVEVLVCGGAPKGSYVAASKGNFVGALGTCGRIKINDPNPNWAIETMPKRRVMGDMMLLPNGDVLLINGAGAGTAGWEFGRGPVLNPVVYHPAGPEGKRFELQNPTTIPRMYHSTAILLRDGRVLVGGSNPHVGYSFSGVLFPTELSLEAFSPSYLDPGNSDLRPKIQAPASQAQLKYGQKFAVVFTVAGSLAQNAVSVTIVAPPFTTHAYSMNQRLLVIGGKKVAAAAGKNTFSVEAVAPASATLAPSGYYLLFVVHQMVPSEGIWIKID